MTRVGPALAILVSIAALLTLGCRNEGNTKKFGMINAQGQNVGSVLGTDLGEKGGIKLVLDVSKLPPGAHGLHVHAIGKCDPPDFASAGAHFNPDGKKHGLGNPDGPHAGDLPNLVVGQNGTAKVEIVAAGIPAGPKHDLFPDGAALVIHNNPDDEKTDPSGNSGARIACGVMVEPSK